MDIRDTYRGAGFVSFDSGFKMPDVSPAPKFTAPPAPAIGSVSTAGSAGGGNPPAAPPPGAKASGGAASYSWITQGVGMVVGAAGSFFEKQMESDTAKSISSGDRLTKEKIAEASLDVEAFIQRNHDLTAIEIEKIRAMAAMNKPVDNSRNWIMMGVFSFLIVSTVGVLYIGSRQSG